jgi:hypothetical protein
MSIIFVKISVAGRNWLHCLFCSHVVICFHVYWGSQKAVLPVFFHSLVDVHRNDMCCVASALLNTWLFFDIIHVVITSSLPALN